MTPPVAGGNGTAVAQSWREPAMLPKIVADLAVNVPMLRAGLPPITFAGVRGAGLLDGLRGVWERERAGLM